MSDRDVVKNYYILIEEKYCDVNGRSIRKYFGKGKGRKGSKDYEDIIKKNNKDNFLKKYYMYKL